ncbi:MAG: PLP-dependent aminotransferase family protein [Chloroflexi bacterium]|nr:PLP-dependent aminotransferase family protein [Chloroflexota bacterium]
MEFQLDRQHAKPLYIQLSEQLQERIRSGSLPAGTKLPPVRDLAESLGLTRLTVHNAYSELQASGWVEAYVGRGTFVAERIKPIIPAYEIRQRVVDELQTPWFSQGMLADMLRLAQQPNLISFAQAAPAEETFPVREIGRAIQQALRDPSALGYGPTQGELCLREAIATWLLDRNVVTSPDHVLVTTGAQQGVALALKAFVRQGDVVLVEEPTYLGFIEQATALGVRLIGIPLDDQGLRLDILQRVLCEYKPRLLYTVPTFHNPTGVCLSTERQEALLQLAQEHNLIILEDDVYGPLSYDAQAPHPIKARDTHGRVVYLGSFSKILTPGLRLGYLVARDEFLHPLLTAKRGNDLHCSPLLQRALADYLGRGQLAAHLRYVRELYRERRDAMERALNRYCPRDIQWTHPRGGLCYWLTLPSGLNGTDIYTEAIEAGVGVTLGNVFFPQPPRNAHLRLCFATQSPELIDRGIRILGDVLTRHVLRCGQLAARAWRETTPLM